MEKKIFFTDLDGTLLNDEKLISKGNQEAIDEALAAGHKIVIATGRPLASASIQAERLGLMREGCYAIVFNGAQIYDLGDQKTLYGKGVPEELVVPIFRRAEELDLQVQTFSDHEVLTERDRPEVHHYVERTLQKFKVVPDIAAELTGDPYKILAIDESRHDVLVQFQQELLNKYSGILDAYFSNDAYLEIVSDQISKGYAVEWLCGYLGIPIENSVAAGDAPNDLPMLKAAHVGAAMANAYPEVMDLADYVTKNDNNHDGVAEIIRKFILEDAS